MGKELFEILKNGDIEKLKLYIENKGDIKVRDGINRTLLHVGVLSGNLSIVKYLLENGLKIEDKNMYGCTALHTAALCGHISIVEYLLELGANVEDKDKYGNTLLHEAACYGHLSLVKLLLKKGAMVEVENDHGYTPLHNAAWRGHLSIVEHLLKNGGNVKTKNCDNETALHVAASEGHLSIVEYLLKNGAKAGDKNKCGETTLHRGALSGKVAVVESLLNNGVKVVDKNNKGETALHHAVHRGSLSVIGYLLKNGANVGDKNNEGDTVLHTAAKRKDIHVVKYLLNCPDVNPNEENNAGETGLDISVKLDDWDNVFLFLKKGAYVDMLLNNIDIERVVRSTGKTGEILKSAIKLLNLANCDQNFSTSEKIINEKLKILGQSINGRQIQSGNTALHIAIFHKKTDMVKMLLEQGADVLIKNHLGENALELIKKTYPQNAYLLALANECAFNLTGETVSYQKHYKIFLNSSVLKKQMFERQEFETKESKEQKETNEMGEIKEQQLFLLESKEIFERCEHYLEKIESYLDKLTEEQKIGICLRIAKLLSNSNRCLFSPARAYQFLSYVGGNEFAQNPKFSEAHKIMLELLISKSVIFEIGIDGKPTPALISVELDGQSTIESTDAKSHRLFCIINHIFNCKSEHDEVLGKYISDYILGAGSVIGLKEVRDKSIISQLALIKSFKEEVELARNRDQELKERKSRVKILEDKLQKREIEIKEMQAKLKLNCNKTQNGHSM